MPTLPSRSTTSQPSLGFEAKHREAADVLRNNMDPGEYKHVVPGLICLKYIPDAFAERQDELHLVVAESAAEECVADPVARKAELAELLEDRDEYVAEKVCWVPKAARRASIMGAAIRHQIELPVGSVTQIGGYTTACSTPSTSTR